MPGPPAPPAVVLEEEHEWERQDAAILTWLVAGFAGVGLFVALMLGAWLWAAAFAVAGALLARRGWVRRHRPGFAVRVEGDRLVLEGAGSRKEVPLADIDHAALVPVGRRSLEAGFVTRDGRRHLLRRSAMKGNPKALVDALQAQMPPPEAPATKVVVHPSRGFRFLVAVLVLLGAGSALAARRDPAGWAFAAMVVAVAVLAWPQARRYNALEMRGGRLVRRSAFGGRRSWPLAQVAGLEVLPGPRLLLTLRDGTTRRLSTWRLDEHPLRAFCAAVQAEAPRHGP